ncbi:MAG: hypothetical protein AAGK32_08525, partial [Actinomycetota bacterium]
VVEILAEPPEGLGQDAAVATEAIGVSAYLGEPDADPVAKQLNLAAEISQMSSPASVHAVADQLAEP